MRSRDDMISRAGRSQNPSPGFHWLEALTLGILGLLEIEVLQMPVSPLISRFQSSSICRILSLPDSVVQWGKHEP